MVYCSRFITGETETGETDTGETETETGGTERETGETETETETGETGELFTVSAVSQEPRRSFTVET